MAKIGNQSYFCYEELKVKDVKGLIEFIEGLPKESPFKPELTEWLPVLRDGKDIPDIESHKKHGLTDWFAVFHGYKIQGYWYPKFCQMLLELAFFLEGFAEFEEEQGFRFWINFKRPCNNFLISFMKIFSNNIMTTYYKSLQKLNK